jgi:FkbM family methyltransferase
MNIKLKISSPRNDLRDSLIHLKKLGYYPDMVIDVGAAQGTKKLYKAFPNAEFLWIEPLPEFNSSLKKIKVKGKIQNIIIGNKRCTQNFSICKDHIGSSIFEINDSESNIYYERREVEQHTLDEIVFQQLPNKVLLRIGVQGAELNVLQGAPETLKKCDVIIIDIFFFNFFKNSPSCIDVFNILKNEGFAIYDICEGHNRPLDDALAQRLFIFVKENGQFRKEHIWADALQKKRYYKL